MVEVEHAPLCRVQLNPMRGVVEVLHRALDFGFDLRVLRLVIERAVLKDEVFPLGNVREEHLCGHLAAVVGGKPRAVALRAQIAPVAQPARRVIEIAHDLPGVLSTVVIVELAPDALEQAADRFAVLSGDERLLLPEVPVAVALAVFDVQELVCGDRHEICFDAVL